MVLFLVTETLRLLDLYQQLRDEPHNVTTNGLLLKQHAREKLTNALNASFPRDQLWTEGQVAVKFKNLRSEYVELKWLSTQPGYREDGVGLSDEWWKGIKRRRHKAHAFKGKLPWVFHEKMKAIVGNYQSKHEQKHMWMSMNGDEMKMEEEEEEEENQQLILQNGDGDGDGSGNEELLPTGTRQCDEMELLGLRSQHKRKYNEDVKQMSTKRVSGRCDGFSCEQSLARSVEQSSVAAAGMARGFQDLINMFQKEATQCRVLEQQVAIDGKEIHALADQRRVLLAIASSLENSTRATADVANGYCKLVSAFVRETADTEKQLRQEPDA